MKRLALFVFTGALFLSVAVRAEACFIFDGLFGNHGSSYGKRARCCRPRPTCYKPRPTCCAPAPSTAPGVKPAPPAPYDEKPLVPKKTKAKKAAKGKPEKK